MTALSVRLVRAAFLFLALGVVLGVTFALDRTWGPRLRPLHAELNLWGWATLLVYGMAYHVLPRFSGRPLRWPRWAEAQSYAAVAGVALVALGWTAQAMRIEAAPGLLLAGGLLQAAAAVAFATMIGRLLTGR